ncbi:MAG: M43 family zinc metalloprotease [Chitinophagaceae bacterium]
MRRLLPFALMLFLLSPALQAQRPCASSDYLNLEIQKDPTLALRLLEAEQTSRKGFGEEILSETPNSPSQTLRVITIPVVVHVLYHDPNEKITEQQVLSQIEILNQEFRKTHADTSLIPTAFKNLAADCYIEFALAKVTPQGYATNGIVYKSTSQSLFGLDDRIKFTSKGGADAWDSKRYLNIWVGNLVSGVIGYSSPLGGPAEKDGVVIAYYAFGTSGKVTAPYSKGRTAVHEIGHWMGLKHIWGDQYCGDDGVDDTPQQSVPTRGCPSASVYGNCTNAQQRLMFNNYMDLTNDDCLNMFTLGQRERIRNSFQPGAAHYALTLSDALTATPIPEPIQSQEVQPVPIRVFPNPSTSKFILDVSARPQMIGTLVSVYNQLGMQVLTVRVSGLHTEINLAALKDGMYFLRTIGHQETVKLIKRI